MGIQNSTQFLRLGGGVLLIVGIVGVLGLTANINVFSLDTGENVAHIVLGLVGLAVGFGLKDAKLHRLLTAVVGITALVFGVLGWFLPDGGALTSGAFGQAQLLRPRQP